MIIILLIGLYIFFGCFIGRLYWTRSYKTAKNRFDLENVQMLSVVSGVFWPFSLVYYLGVSFADYVVASKVKVDITPKKDAAP